MSLWLDDNELHALTGYRQRAKQVAVLAALRPPVRFRVRPDDSFPLVDRSQFEGVEQPRKRLEPNYG
jgi:hypothetical protein